MADLPLVQVLIVYSMTLYGITLGRAEATSIRVAQNFILRTIMDTALHESENEYIILALFCDVKGRHKVDKT